MALPNQVQGTQLHRSAQWPFRRSGWFWWTSCIVLITLGLYWRRPDAFYNPQLWGEDASRFFTGVNLMSIPETFVTPYAGYYHTLARLVAAIGTWVPVTYIPAWYTFAAYALLVLLITYLFSPRFPFQPSIKFVMGLALVITPIDNEVYFNVANWATLASLFWILLAVVDEPTSPRQRIFDFVLLGLAGLNSPFTICLWPLFALRYWLRRTPHSLYLLIFSLLIAAIQLSNMLGRVLSEVMPPIDFVLLNGIVYRWGFLFLGESIYQIEMTNLWRGGLLISAFVLGAALFWHAWHQKQSTQFTFLVAALAAISLSLYVMRPDWPVLYVTNGRHIYLPTTMLIWSLLLVRFPWKWLVVGWLGLTFLWLTPTLKGNTLPDLHWAERVADCADVKPICLIPTQPWIDPPTWYARLNTRVFTVPPMQTTFGARFGDQLELLGYDLTQQRDEIRLKLVWRALAEERASYTRFVHLLPVEAPDTIATQADAIPLDWQYPTSQWATHEVVIDEVVLELTGVPPGEYQLGVGWYDGTTATLPRLSAVNAAGQEWPEARAILPTLIEIP